MSSNAIENSSNPYGDNSEDTASELKEIEKRVAEVNHERPISW
jgi:hypothetical protein